ncbi:reverse transcriptase domain-containing protein [Tanacetum coccineum]
MIWGYTTMIASISCVSVICLGDDVNVISSDKAEGSGDWNSPEYQDTAVSKGKKVMNALSFYRMETNEISERYIAQCFVNGLEAFDGEINLAFDENLIPNEFAVKLCLDYEDDSEKTGKSSNDWDQLLDFNIDDVPKSREELPPFVCKMGKSNHNKKRAMENFNLFYQDIRPFALAGRHLTQEEVAKEELAIRISQRYALLEEERPTVKEDKEAVKRTKGEALKEKEDPGAFIFPIRLEGKVNENALADTGSDINTMPYRIFETLGREDMKKVDRGITMIDHTPAKAMGKLSNVLCQVGVTTIIAKFFILDIPIDHDALIVVGWGFLHTIGSLLNTSERIFLTFDEVCHQTFRAARFDVLRTAESDSDDEDEYVIKRNKFGAPIYAPRPAPYPNCANPEDQSLAIQVVTNPFRKISVWKKAVSFLGSLPVPLKLQEHTTEKPDCHNPNAQEMKPWKRVQEAESKEEIFTSMAWIRAFNINEPIYAELCHEFYSLYELMNISREENLGLSRSHTSTIRNPILRVIYKMITYGLCQRMTGYDKAQKNDLCLLSMFDARHQNGYANVAWDLYDRMGRMEIRQDAIERMEYRQSYHWDRYHGVFEHMAGVYSVPLQGAYNPPGYAQL